MASYKEIQKYVKQKHGYSVKTCWIAHVKELCGIVGKVAPNRLNIYSRANPCPDNKLGAIKEAFKHFRMI